MYQPSILKNLKTTPGGSRRLGMFSPEIHDLWKMLSSPKVTLNATHAARELGVHHNTVRRWLRWMERHKLIHIVNDGGGRGLRIEATWHIRRHEMNARRRASPQRSVFQSSTDSNNYRARAMKAARTVLQDRLPPRVATEAIKAVGVWVWSQKPTVATIEAAVGALKKARRIPVPRWAKTRADLHRWFQGLLRQLVAHGASWWGKLQQAVEKRRLGNVLDGIKRSVEQGVGCPVCGKVHTRLDWREGRTGGDLNCAGWCRIKEDDLIERQESRLERRLELAPQEAWARWIDQQALYGGAI